MWRAVNIDPIVAALIDRRRAVQMTQEGLGLILGVSTSTVGCWEAGQTLPSLPRLREWAQVLGMMVSVCEAADLIGEVAA